MCGGRRRHGDVPKSLSLPAKSFVTGFRREVLITPSVPQNFGKLSFEARNKGSSSLRLDLGSFASRLCTVGHVYLFAKSYNDR